MALGDEVVELIILNFFYKTMSKTKEWKEKASQDLKDAWIRGAVRGLREISEDQGKKLLKESGRSCAESWLEFQGIDLRDHDIDSFISLLRSLEGGVREVKREGNVITCKLKHGECVCPLVTDGTVELSPELCSSCGTNFFAHLFGKVVGKEVRVDLVESVATGARACVFKIVL